jgi:selenocysteine lyase/cysteine desulfurase
VIKTVPSDFNGASTDDEIVAEFMKLVNANTKFVTFSHLSNVGDRLLPGEKICKVVHASYPNCHVHIDGAMTWGCMNLNLVQMDCDR